MPQTMPKPASLAERLALRMCKRANAIGSTDASPHIAQMKRQSSAGVVSAAINIAVERGWLRREGDAYVVTPTGAGLGGARSGKRIGRVMPF